jgi:hypothetical protein
VLPAGWCRASGQPKSYVPALQRDERRISLAHVAHDLKALARCIAGPRPGRLRANRRVAATLCVEIRAVSNPDAEKDGELLTARLTSGVL